MSLKEQRKYGGPSMAGLSMRANQKTCNVNGNDSKLYRIANADPKMIKMTREAASAFPALAHEDPALYQLMESVDVLEARFLTFTPPLPNSIYLHSKHILTCLYNIGDLS